MYKVSEVTSTSWPTNSRLPQPGNGFYEYFTEAMKASDKKLALIAKATKDNKLYQITNSVDQLVHSGQRLNATNLEKNRLTAGMLNLYIAQERKDEKTGRGRAVACNIL